MAKRFLASMQLETEPNLIFIALTRLNQKFKSEEVTQP